MYYDNKIIHIVHTFFEKVLYFLLLNYYEIYKPNNVFNIMFQLYNLLLKNKKYQNKNFIRERENIFYFYFIFEKYYNL